ncbi:MAG: molybdopterin-dependent oxidoreductase [Bryobacterales bacterium]|nr:molybdopterin-dependent oxidoreductase [Bryobacterales bacterium]
MNRRNLLSTGLAAAAGASGLAVAGKLADDYGLVPPDAGGIWAPGQTLTYGAQRLIGRHALAREFTPDQISRPAYANGKPPKDEAFLRHQGNNFADWTLAVDGLVARPTTFSIPQLRSYPAHSQITHLACEEGWSFIAQWTGVRLSHILELVGAFPQARYIMYFSIQPRWWDSVDMVDALHPQTILTYSMNGAELPVGNGGPLRVRVPRQLGYKSVKYVTRLTVTDSVAGYGAGKGSQAAERGYVWYSGI